jgi:hypothetical protein
LDRRLEAVQGAGQRSSAAAEQVAARERFARARPSALDVLYDLHLLLPAGLRLDQFTYEPDGTVIVRGRGSNLTQVMNAVQALDKAKSLARVRLESSRLAGAGRATFQIRAALAANAREAESTR